MGMEFGLYAKQSKEFIWLGKSREKGFQMDPLVISEFLERHLNQEFFMVDDMAPTPDGYEDGWKCVASWEDYIPGGKLGPLGQLP